LNRREAIEVFVRHRGEAPVIVGPGVSGRALYELGPKPATLYNMELGYAAAMCLGLAAALPKERVFALEGDGSMLMGLGTLTTVARYRIPNLVILVIDNGQYLSSGAVPSATATGSDLVAIAKGAGIEHAERVRDPAALDAVLRRAATTDGPHFIVAAVDPETLASLGEYRALPFDIVESAIRFRRSLEERGLVPTIWAI
jgi:thiamine pyrophosphate-dependent acetolactate synthase large subunit-like protein